MSISVECRRCGRRYKVKEEAEGKKIKCKECGTVIQVPMRKQPQHEDDFLDDFDADEWDAPPVPRRSAPRPARKRASKRPAKRGGSRRSRSRGNDATRTLLLLGGIPMGLCLLLGLVAGFAQGGVEPFLSSFFMGLVFASLFITLGGLWRVFEKAGQPGWMCIVPIANVIVLHEIAGVPVWFIIGWFVPCVNLIVIIIVYMGVARNFGQSPLFGLGLAFFGFIFFPLLGFGDYRYEGSYSF